MAVAHSDMYRPPIISSIQYYITLYLHFSNQQSQKLVNGVIVSTITSPRETDSFAVKQFPFSLLQHSFIHFFHSGHFYSASSGQLLLRSAPDTAQILCRSFTPKRHRQLRVKDLPKVPTWRLERNSNPRPSDRKALTLPKRHYVPSTHSFLTLINLS